MAERSFKQEVKKLRLGRRRGIPRRRHSRRHQGAAAIRRVLCLRLPGRADLAPDGRARRCQRHPGGAGRPVRSSASEATAAATLAASVNYPLRGAATFKSPVGTNVASDALANLASSGVTGGALIIVGEDYGEGSSIMQERSHAFAMKSQIWLLDPRPNLPSIVRRGREGLRAVRGVQYAGDARIAHPRLPRLRHASSRRDNVRPSFTLQGRAGKSAARHEPYRAAAGELSAGEGEDREALAGRGALRAGQQAQRVLRRRRRRHRHRHAGRHVQHDAARPRSAGACRCFRRKPRPALRPQRHLSPRSTPSSSRFCAGKKAILVVEEGQPEFIEQAINTILRRADIQTRIEGKRHAANGGRIYRRRDEGGRPQVHRELSARSARCSGSPPARRSHVVSPVPQAIAGKVHGRPPSFCTGCPERPIFAAMKLVERELGPHHVSCDIGCHLFSVLPPFNIGQLDDGLWPRRRGRGGVQCDRGQARHRARRRRRILAQRARLELRQRRLQQERQRHDRGGQRLCRRDRRAGRALVRGRQRAALDQAIR